MMAKTEQWAAVLVLAAAVGLPLPVGIAGEEPGPTTRPSRAERLPEGAVKCLGSDRFVATGNIAHVAFSPDGSVLATADTAHRITLWDAASGRWVREFDAPAGKERRLAAMRFDADGNVVCVGVKGPLTILDPAGGDVLDSRDLGNKGRVLRGTLSGDGMRVGLTRPDGSGAILDRRTGRIVATLDPPERANPCKMALSGDGSVLAVAYPNNALRVVAEGEEFSVQEKIPTPVSTALALSNDGSLLAMALRGGAVRVYDVKSGVLWMSDQVLPHQAMSDAGEIAFSPDGKLLLAVFAGGRVCAWDLQKKEVLWEAMDAAIHSLETAVDVRGNSVAIAGGNCVEVRDLRTGKLLLDVTGHRGPLRDLAFSPDGRRLVSAGLDGRCHLWDLRTGQAREVLRASEPLHAVSFDPDGGQIVAAGMRTGFLVPASGTKPSTTFHVSEAKAQGVFDHPEMLDFMSGQIRCAAAMEFVPGDAAVRVVAAEGVLKSVDCRDGNVLTDRNWDRGLLVKGRIGVRRRECKWVSVATGGQLMAASVFQTRDASIYVFDLTEGGILYQLEDRSALDSVLALSDDEMLLAVSNDSKVTLYELLTRRPLKTLSFPGEVSISTLRFSGAGTLLAAGSEDGRVAAWPLGDLDNPVVREGHCGSVEALAFARDGRILASGGKDTRVLLWNVPEATKADGTGDVDRDRMEADWKALSDRNPAKAHAALWRLVAAGDRAVAFLADRLEPAGGLDVDRVRELIVQLDADTYAERTAAQAALTDMGPKVEPFARRALEESTSTEQRNRLEAILSAVRPSGALDNEALRVRRALAVLERTNTVKAQELLERLAGGAGHATITARAAETLQRMRFRQGEAGKPEATTRPAE